MGVTGHVRIGQNYKEYRCDSVDKIASKDSKTNTDLIEYFPEHLWRKK